MSDERSEGLQGGEGDPGPETLLDSLDQMIGSLPAGDPVRRELLQLRPHILDQQETMIEARRMIEKLEEVVKKVTSPANRIGTLIVPGLPPSGPRMTRPCMPTLTCTMLFGPIRHSRAVVPMVT